MNTLCYIVVKITILSLIHLWISVKCSRRAKKKSTQTSTSSYIEENTKAEERFERPAWDKNFPKILPPPVHVPEKENKEVDVELDMLMMPGSLVDPAPPPKAGPNNQRLDILDPNELMLDDRTQPSRELMASKERAAIPAKKSAEKPRSDVNPLRSKSNKPPKQGKTPKSGKSGKSGKSAKSGKSIKSEESGSSEVKSRKKTGKL